MHITTRFKCDNPLKIDHLWHLNEKKCVFSESSRYYLSRFAVYIRMGKEHVGDPDMFSYRAIFGNWIISIIRVSHKPYFFIYA